MKRILAIGVGAGAALLLGIGGAPAQGTPTIDEAVKIIQSVGNDAEKLKQFCELNKLLDSVGEKEDPATEKQIEDAVEKLGDDFAAAWEVGEKTDEKSADGKMFYDAVGALTEKCS
jgi:hypothetical protein